MCEAGRSGADAEESSYFEATDAGRVHGDGASFLCRFRQPGPGQTPRASGPRATALRRLLNSCQRSRRPLPKMWSQWLFVRPIIQRI